jgi:hypothetical protein
MAEGVMIAIGPCFGCNQIFGFDPELVPSIVYDGERRQICLACVTRANPFRKENGLPPIVPLPGAYPGEEGGSGE